MVDVREVISTVYGRGPSLNFPSKRILTPAERERLSRI